jgi:hypothetical protein
LGSGGYNLVARHASNGQPANRKAWSESLQKQLVGQLQEHVNKHPGSDVPEWLDPSSRYDHHTGAPINLAAWCAVLDSSQTVDGWQGLLRASWMVLVTQPEPDQTGAVQNMQNV